MVGKETESLVAEPFQYRVLDRERNGWFDVLRRKNESEAWQRIASVWGESRANWLADVGFPTRDQEVVNG